MNSSVTAASSHECRVCGHAMSKWRSAWLGYEWGRCRQCCSVQKLISETEYENLNPSYDPGYEPGVSDAAELLLHMDVDEKEKLLRKMVPTIHKGRLLDIGCGMGGYLLAGARMGLDVQGVEPSASHGKAAVDLFGLNVIEGYYKRDMFVEKFDIIILSHVIEHIYKPAEFLRDVVDALAPQGKLLVITPNAQSLSAKVCGRYWSMYKPIDHVTMVGKSTVRHMVPEGAKLELVETSEWNGEFAAHLLSALRTFIRPAMANTGGSAAALPKGRSTLGAGFRSVLAALSWPFKLLGRLLDRQACLYFVVRKNMPVNRH